MDYLEYDPLDGSFTWIRSPARKIRVGQKAGNLTVKGYWKLRFEGKEYKAHRLAFLFMEGWLPEEVDHEDLNSSNNAWNNLRAASRIEQNRNRQVFKNNRLGVKGVTRQGKRFRARITIDERCVTLGYFDTLPEATEAYAAAAKKNFGAFARMS
jgi:hypothetical protein